MTARRWMAMAAAMLAAPLLVACGGDDERTWVIGLDAGSDATRAEIRIQNGDDIRTFETDLPWRETIVMPDGSYSITLTVRSLDGKEVGCGIDGPHDPDKLSTRMTRESQGGGTAVECRMTGAISGNEYSWESQSEILSEGEDVTSDTNVDTVPDTEVPATSDAPEPTAATTAATTTAAPPTTTGADDSPRVTYENGVLKVLLDDLHEGSPVVLSIAIGEGLEFGEPRGLPDYLITSTEFPNAIVNIDLSPTFGDELAEIVPEAPGGYAIDIDISTGDMVGAVQQPNGAADERRLYGTVVLGEWKARLVVYVDGSALDSGAVTMDQAAALLTKIMQSFAVTPA